MNTTIEMSIETWGVGNNLTRGHINQRAEQLYRQPPGTVLRLTGTIRLERTSIGRARILCDGDEVGRIRYCTLAAHLGLETWGRYEYNPTP